MAFESFQSEEMRKPKKTKFASTTAEHGGYLKSFLAAPKDQTTSFASIINYYRSLREELETLISSTPANNYHRTLKERLKILTSSTSTNNHCCSLKEGLEI